MKNVDVTDVRLTWDAEYPQYDDLGRKIKEEISRILKENGLSAKTMYRVKETDSLIKKIARKESDYDSIHDKVGVRIIAYFKEQMAVIDELLKTQFHYEIIKREDMSVKLGEDVFGYQSIHYDIRVVESEKEYYCELQLRTICQDNWSELSHALAYKTEIQIPQRIKREINALSAVFELADNQFQLIQSLINDLPDTNPIRILNHIEKFFYTYLGNIYDKELSSYFLKDIDKLYIDINPIDQINSFIDQYKKDIISKVNNNNLDYFFSQPEILIILERLQNDKYNLITYWDILYPHNELESIANIWGTSIE